MNKKKKQQLINLYLKLFNEYECILFIQNLGLSVEDFDLIRFELDKENNKLLVIKNNIIKISLYNLKHYKIINYLYGSLFIIYTNDLISLSKQIVKLYDNNFCIDIIGGIFNDNIIYKKKILNLSNLPSQKNIRNKIILILKIISEKILLLINITGFKLVKLIKEYNKLIVK